MDSYELNENLKAEEKLEAVRWLEKTLGYTPPPVLVETYLDLEEEERTWPGTLSWAYQQAKAKQIKSLGILAQVRAAVEALGWDRHHPERAAAIERAVKVSLEGAVVDVDLDEDGSEDYVEVYGVVNGNPVHFYVVVDYTRRRIGAEMAEENIPPPEPR